MSDLVEFLRARVAEDEAAVSDPNVPGSASAGLSGQPPRQYWSKDRARREVQAKRLLLAEHTPEQGIPYDGGDENDPSTWVPCCSRCQVGVVQEGDWPCLHLRLLALPYADHPDYREEWKP